MVEILLYSTIGVLAGLIGGLLGIGGSTVILPALIFSCSVLDCTYTGQMQHLFQATAMICNFFIAMPATLAHFRARAMVPGIVARLVPTALAGILAGVAVSNTALFAGQQGRYLAFLLGGFFVYVVAYNIRRLVRPIDLVSHFDPQRPWPLWRILVVGGPAGILGGLLGIGGGALFVPAQQVVLRVPLRNAIANSAATICFTAAFGATYKLLTLDQHGYAARDALRLAGALVPTAILAGYLGGRLAHRLPRKLLRAVFIVFMTIAAIQTFRKAAAVPAQAPAADQTAPLQPEPTTEAHPGP